LVARHGASCAVLCASGETQQADSLNDNPPEDHTYKEAPIRAVTIDSVHGGNRCEDGDRLHCRLAPNMWTTFVRARCGRPIDCRRVFVSSDAHLFARPRTCLHVQASSSIGRLAVSSLHTERSVGRRRAFPFAQPFPLRLLNPRTSHQRLLRHTVCARQPWGDAVAVHLSAHRLDVLEGGRMCSAGRRSNLLVHYCSWAGGSSGRTEGPLHPRRHGVESARRQVNGQPVPRRQTAR